MSSGWSAFVIVLTLANILGCIWLMWWTAKPKRADEKIGGGVDTGHVWDGDLREYNNPMPRWWLWLFYITIVFALGYLVLYPGFGAFSGVLGWSQAAQYDREKQAADARTAEWFAPFAAMTQDQLAAEPRAMAAAHNVFQNQCAQCHGSDGGGARGFPNLRDADWIWGGDADSIALTIRQGRMGAMPGWGPVLGDQGIEQVIAYVRTLGGRPADPAAATAGKAHFETVCVACHGADGRGNPLLGAPNLTDDTWLYGGDDATLRESILKGRTGQMPAFADALGDQRVRLLAAYVSQLSAGGSPHDDDDDDGNDDGSG